MTDTLHADVLIIGGGASGMMAAITAAEQGARVLLIEKNKRLGEKLRITGGGRCNILNAEQDVRTLLANYGDAAKYLYSAFSTFGMQHSWDFFERIKLPLKIEDRKRAFPESEKAVDVVHAMQNKMHRLGVNIVTNSRVTGIDHKSQTITGIRCGDAVYTAHTYVFATGGVSRPETGSTGDGFRWLGDLGHNIINPTPNITPLALESAWKDVAAGKSLVDCEVKFIQHNKKVHETRGGVVFTHFGVSGPIILNSASKIEPFLQQNLSIHFDLFPHLTADALDKLYIETLNSNGNKLLKNTLPIILPAGTTPLIKAQLNGLVDFDTKNSELPKSARQLLVQTSKALPATITGLMGFDKAVVADGGVPLSELDMRTMKSLHVTNVYITGDLLHIQRPSGGYSLQLCWTTGYIAGTEAAKWALVQAA